MFSLTIKLDDKIVRLVKYLVSFGMIFQEDASNLRPTALSPATLYRLPKLHKPQIPLLAINEIAINNSYEFSKDLSTFKLPQEKKMCCYDIKSLIVNILLMGTIKICTDLVFKNSNEFSGMTKTTF